jgi:hypothetical protein
MTWYVPELGDLLAGDEDEMMVGELVDLVAEETEDKEMNKEDADVVVVEEGDKEASCSKGKSKGKGKKRGKKVKELEVVVKKEKK